MRTVGTLVVLKSWLNWFIFYVTKSTIRNIYRAVNRLSNLAIALVWLRCIFVITIIIYSVLFSPLHTSRLNSMMNDTAYNADTSVLINSIKETIQIKVETAFDSETLNTENIYLSAFSGEYREVSTILTINNTSHKYLTEEIFFTLTTNTERILESIHYLKFWVKSPGINCLIVFEQIDFMNNRNITDYLVKEGISCKIQTSNRTRYEERYLELFHLAWNSQDMTDTYGKRQKVQWFAVGDDDTVWFINNLLYTLQQYNSSDSIYLGNISDKKSAIRLFGAYFAYGGAGILLSRPLALLFSQHNRECKRFLNIFGGDGMIGKCITEVLKVNLTKNINFHQMDHRGDMTGLLESGIDGLVSLHHMFSYWNLFPDELANDRAETMRILQIAYTTFDKHLFKRYVRVNHKTKQTLLLTMGYAFSVFNRILSHMELSLIEKTWCCDQTVDRKPRVQENKKITWYFRELTTETSKRRIKHRLVCGSTESICDWFPNIEVTLIN